MFAGPRPSLSSPSAGIRHPVGIPTALSVGIGAVLALLFSTVVQMLFGELFPKNLAIDRPEPAARRLARSTTVYLKVFGWLLWVFDQAANLLLRALKIEPVHRPRWPRRHTCPATSKSYSSLEQKPATSARPARGRVTTAVVASV